VHPIAGTQPSLVHVLPSSQILFSPALHAPATQPSPIVHSLPSEQPVPAATGFHVQPASGEQLSTVQRFWSSQVGAAPPTHVPPEHWSPVVHSDPSSQPVPVSFPNEQPVEGMQVVPVQGFPSSHLLVVPAPHEAPTHASPTVQALPSSHGKPFCARCPQPLFASHESLVHTLLSSQFFAAPAAQAPLAQTSPTVHASPSSHFPSFGAYAQPLAGAHPSLVQGLPSSQPLVAPPAHLPSLHTSPTVQALPSSQAWPPLSRHCSSNSAPPDALVHTIGWPSACAQYIVAFGSIAAGQPPSPPATAAAAAILKAQLPVRDI